MSGQSVSRPSFVRVALGAALIVAAWFAGISMLGADVRSFVYVSGALVVAAGPALLLLGGSGRRLGIGDAAVAAGVIGTILGLIRVMENLDKPDQIGPGVALALVASIYGLAAYVLTASSSSLHNGDVRRLKTELPFYGLLASFLLIAFTLTVLFVLKLHDA